MDSRPSGSRKKNGDQVQKRGKDQKQRADTTRRLIGLCVNCAKRETCDIPDSEGGIWRCEQYVEAC